MIFTYYEAIFVSQHMKTIELQSKKGETRN
jgi:hypothetical protein